MTDKTVLIIDDDASIRDMVCIALEVAGFNCLQAENTCDGHALIVDRKPDLVLLDGTLPSTSGMDLLRRLRTDELAGIPVIVLADKEGGSVVQGIDVDIDHYLAKPFSPRELIAQVKTVLRNKQPDMPEDVLRVMDLEFDPISYRVSIGGQPVAMPPADIRLLIFFLTHQDRVYSRGQILEHVWGGNGNMDERTIDVYIRRLRKTLSVKDHEQLIQTVRGLGYRFSTKLNML